MKHISILVPEGQSNLSSIVVPYMVFTKVNDYLQNSGKKPLFSIHLVGNSKKIGLHEGLFSIHPNASYKDVRKTDLIIIPAINHEFSTSVKQNAVFMPWIVDHYKKGAEVASICTGSFLLAETGLLKGKDCSTHWHAATTFSKMFPEVNVITDKIITDGHGLYTNGGAFSFLHLLLYLVEKYCGREIAIYCSKIFQIDMDRDCQSPFTMFIGQKDHQDKAIKKAQQFIENNLSEKISVEQLASMVSVGRRNFDRRFKKATANSPVEYSQRAKIEAAKKKLETGRDNIGEIMQSVGYSDTKAFRTIFKKITGLSPIEYRSKYNKEAVLFDS